MCKSVCMVGKASSWVFYLACHSFVQVESKVQKQHAGNKQEQGEACRLLVETVQVANR